MSGAGRAVVTAGGATQRLGPPLRRRAGTAVVLLLGCLLLFATRVRETAGPGPELDLDQAWKASLADRAEHGEIAGRDFFYTYGAATQLVTWAATRLHATNDPLASVPLADLLFVVLNLVLLGLILWQFELGALGMAIALAVLAAARVPEHYPSFRTLLVVLAALAAGAALAEGRRARRLALAATAGTVAVLAQLVSADLLVLAALAIAGTAVGSVALELWRERRLGFPVGGTLRGLAAPMLWILSVAAFAICAGNAALAAFGAPRAGWLGYHRDLVDMIVGYGLTMGHNWALDSGRTMALIFGIALLIRWTMRAAVAAPPRERAQLLALLAAAGVSARAAFTRSDIGHIALAFTPCVLLLALLSARELRRTHRLGGASVGALVLLLAGWPLGDIGGIGRALGAPIRFDDVRDRLRELRRAQVDRQDLLRRASLRRGVPSRLAAVRGLLDGDAVAVVPWENHLAIALGARQAGTVLQAYAVHTPEAQARYLEALRGQPAAQVLLAVDHLATRPLDGVLTTARLPVIVRGLLEELEPPAAPGRAPPFLLLQRRAAPRRLSAAPLAIADRTTSERGREDLMVSPTPCRLLAIELVLAYPPWVALGRPEPIELEVSGPRGPIVLSRVVPLRAGDPFEILVPLLSMERFVELWAEPTGTVPLVTRLRLRRVSGPLAAAPWRREVRGVSCLEWVE